MRDLGQSSEMLDAALACVRRGWSVIPVEPGGKKPLIPWMVYQQRQPTEDEVRLWWSRVPTAGVAVITGCVSSVVVVDVDGPRGEASVSELAGVVTVGSRTGRGRHLWFRHPGGRVASRAGVRRGVDIRGDGGYVIVPRSWHSSGRRYEWVEGRGPGDVELQPVPEWVMTAPPPSPRGRSSSAWVELLAGVDEGGRNDAAARLGGLLLGKGFTEEESLALAECWNRANRPPLSRDELACVVASVARAHAMRLDEFWNRVQSPSSP